MYGEFCQATRMFHPIRKFIAVLMLLWLPLFSGNALAAAVSMQMSGNPCHDPSMQMMSDVEMADMMDIHLPHREVPASSDQHGTPCSAICHLACAAYLVVPMVELIAVQISPSDVSPYLLSFHSVTSAPLVPPPLSRA